MDKSVEQLIKDKAKEINPYQQSTSFYGEHDIFQQGCLAMAQEIFNSASTYNLIDKSEALVGEFDEITKALFWSKVKDTGYCWEWQNATNSKGYGGFGINRKKTICSRIAYEIIHGKIPDDLHVLHTCDNPKCVNPHHLFLGTHQDNMLDKVNKMRSMPGKGKKIGRSSKYIGVMWRIKVQRFTAFVYIDKKMRSFGTYDTEIDAAIARDMAVVKHGLNITLNFPDKIEQYKKDIPYWKIKIHPKRIKISTNE